MKKLFALLIFFVVCMYACTVMYAQTFTPTLSGSFLQSTPTGIQFYRLGSGKDVIIYMDGYSSSPNPLGSTFYKNFYPSISHLVTCYMPVPLASQGWEKRMSNGKYMGTDFLDWVADQHPESRIFVTGYSAGGDSGYLYAAKRVTAFASVAGSDLNGYAGMMNWRSKGVPVWAFIGTNDTSENSRPNCEKTWITWFYNGGKSGNLKDGQPTYVNGGHGSVPAYAYNPVNGLWDWFNKQGRPPEIRVDIPGKAFYLRDGKIVFEFEDGSKKVLTPD